MTKVKMLGKEVDLKESVRNLKRTAKFQIDSAKLESEMNELVKTEEKDNAKETSEADELVSENDITLIEKRMSYYDVIVSFVSDITKISVDTLEDKEIDDLIEAASKIVTVVLDIQEDEDDSKK